MTKVFVAQPAYGAGQFERESYDAPEYAMDAFESLAKLPYGSSLLANGFNKGLRICLNDGDWDEFCLLHGDVIPLPKTTWLEILVAERDARGFDAIHAPCAIKDGRGYTSTALSYSLDRWEKKRRLTTTELHQLPETFDIGDVRRAIDPRALALLPNTGCLLFSTKAKWLDAFAGFEIRDKLVRGADGKWQDYVVPEDWNFGYWMHENGLRVGATRKVTPRHVGNMPFMTEVAWGLPRDKDFFDDEEKAA